MPTCSHSRERREFRIATRGTQHRQPRRRTDITAGRFATGAPPHAARSAKAISVHTHLADGRLIRVLADWCPPYPGYHFYYRSRRQPTPGFTLLVNALRYRG